MNVSYEFSIWIIFIICIVYWFHVVSQSFFIYHYTGSFFLFVQSSTIIYSGECHSSRTVKLRQETCLISSECFISELSYIPHIGHCIYLTGMNGFGSYIKCR